MTTPASAASKESTWRNHLARQASSGKSIAAFCRDESLPEWSFYAWRARLNNRASKLAPTLEQVATPFIDLGVVKGHAIPTPAINPNVEVRIDLGGGMLLTITRS